MSELSDNTLEFNQIEGPSLESQLKILRTLLKEQVLHNRELEDKNLDLKNNNVILQNQCEELSAKLGLKSSEAGVFKDTYNAADTNGFSLEIDMLKAKVSSSILKSIVYPLENEVEHLKKRLSEAQTMLDISSYKNKPVKQLPEAHDEDLSNSDSSTHGDGSDQKLFSDQTSNDANNENIEIKKLLENAENFILALTRKNCNSSILLDDILQNQKRLEDDILELNNKLERERAAHLDLKSTWQKANEEFIIQSVNLQDEIHRLRESYGRNRPEIDEKSPRPSSHSSHISTSTDSILLNAELSRLKQELITEKQKILDIEAAMKIFMSETREQIFKCETDCSSLDSLLFGIQNELIRKQSKDFYA